MPASSSNTAASSKRNPPPPSAVEACGAHTPADFAAACSSRRRSSSTPFSNASCSRGITTSATNCAIRCCQSRTRGSILKSNGTGASFHVVNQDASWHVTALANGC